MRWLLPALLAIGCVGTATAQNETGLEVGAQAPAFTLKDQDGKEQKLSELTKDGPVAIVFHRSASW